MLDNYLIIHKSILPDYFDKVLEAKSLIESGKVREVSQAVKQVGISRSTYYKYKDFILQPADFSGGRKAVFDMLLLHEAGVLRSVLELIADSGGSVLTITQSLPIRGLANVTISLDVSNINGGFGDFLLRLKELPGVENPRLIAIE